MSKTVLIATLGFTPEHVVAPLRDHAVADLYVLYGPPGKAETEKALRDVHTMAQLFDVRVHEVVLPDVFDYAHVLRVMEDLQGKLGRQTRILVNGSGGPRPMTMAATIFAFTRDVPLLYYDKAACKDGKVIPLRAYRDLEHFGDSQRLILKRLQKTGSSDMGTLAEKLKLAPSTVTEHVQALARAGAVHVDKEGRRRMVRLEPDLQFLDLEARP